MRWLTGHMARAFASDAVAAAFAAVAADSREGLLALRALIFDTADLLPLIGRLEEALRWGQPAYLTPDSKAGTTIRLGVPKSGKFALFVHCQTSLITDYITMFPGQDRVEGTRAILFDTPDQIDPLRHGWLILGPPLPHYYHIFVNLIGLLWAAFLFVLLGLVTF